MSIYDKRVQNMYLSTNTMQSKLTRISVDIKQKHNNDFQDDDVMQNQDRRKRQQLQERQQLLNISIDDFSGSIDNFEDGFGYSTLEHKSKIDIKCLEDKFIADPLFSRTQKMFDSYSLKSLMLNIFSIDNNLQVQLFNKDKKREEIMKKQKKKKEVDSADQRTWEIQNPDSNEQLDEDQIKMQNLSNLNKKVDEKLQKLIDTNKFLLEKDLFENITSWIDQQAELKRELIFRNNNGDYSDHFLNEEAPNEERFQNIKEKEKGQIDQIFKQFDQNFDNNIGGGYNLKEMDKGLYETHQSQTQQFGNFDISDGSLDKFGMQYEESVHSAPISFQSSFFEYNVDGNVDPINPWQIEFKNNKLIRKKKVSKENIRKKQLKKSNILMIDFEIENFASLQNRTDAFKHKDIKNKFTKQAYIQKKYEQLNLVAKDMQTFFEYNLNKSLKINSQFINDQMNKGIQARDSLRHNNQSFFLDNTQNFFDTGQKKNNQKHFDDEETHMIVQSNIDQAINQNVTPSLDNMTLFNMKFDSISNNLNINSSYVGRGMGINNIREIKKFIYNEIKDKSQVSIKIVSKMLPLSSAQIFTIFLHLVNEYNLEIESTQQDTQIILRMPQNINYQVQQIQL